MWSVGYEGSMRRFHAPGRVNLIGDHIDYMGGTVLPMAIDAGTDLWVSPRADGRIVAVSDNFPQTGTVVADVAAPAPRAQWGWVNYLVGVAHAMRDAGLVVPGVDVRVRGTIPHGAGLSSSASLELAMAVAFDALVDAGLSPAELAGIGQRAENRFIGVACGIMDQLAIATGREGHALLIDCRTLQVTPVPMPQDVTVVVANTNQRRELAGSAYNDRRAACERAEAALGRPLVAIPVDEWEGALAGLPPDIRPRARHVMSEQARVLDFAEAMRVDDRAAMGRLMRQSHESLREDFDVTGAALDAMAQAAWSAPGVIGARMTGAGFGGCTVNLVEPRMVQRFIDHVAARYTAATGLTADFHEVRAAPGAREIPV